MSSVALMRYLKVVGSGSLKKISLWWWTTQLCVFLMFALYFKAHFPNLELSNSKVNLINIENVPVNLDQYNFSLAPSSINYLDFFLS